MIIKKPCRIRGLKMESFSDTEMASGKQNRFTESLEKDSIREAVSGQLDHETADEHARGDSPMKAPHRLTILLEC